MNNNQADNLSEMLDLPEGDHVLIELKNYIDTKVRVARVDELKRALATYNHWPGDFEEGIKETIRIIENTAPTSVNREET